MDVEERMLALIKAHAHVSEGVGSYRKGLGVDGSRSEEHLEGMKEAQQRIESIMVDTALGDE